ncbi:MAG: flagellin [Pseudomonadota bacterium]
MNSINTNASAMTALHSLNQTNKMLNQTQNAISTGYKVANAADNAAYWSIATEMRSDNKALSTVQDALGLGAATVDVASTGIEAVIDVTDEIKKKLVAAREPGVDRAKIQSEITQLQGQIASIATSASFSGENWLSVDSGAAGYNATKSIVSSFNRASDGSVSVSTIDVTITSTELYDADDQSGIIDQDRTVGGSTFKVSTINISALTDSAADLTTLDNYISGVDTAIEELTTAATDLGAVKSRVDLQRDFVTGLMDAIERGVSQLVDADLNEESTKLQALQAQQQLGIQALSIANANSQNILALFR